MTKPISALPDPTAANPDQWSIVARDGVPELWGTMRRGGKQRHNGQFVYPCLDKAHAVDLLRALLEARKLYDLRKGQSQYALGTSPSRLDTVRATLGRRAAQ